MIFPKHHRVRKRERKIPLHPAPSAALCPFPLLQFSNFITAFSFVSPRENCNASCHAPSPTLHPLASDPFLAIPSPRSPSPCCPHKMRIKQQINETVSGALGVLEQGRREGRCWGRGLGVLHKQLFDSCRCNLDRRWRDGAGDGIDGSLINKEFQLALKRSLNTKMDSNKAQGVNNCRYFWLAGRE